MLRVGIDDKIAPELISLLPPDIEIVRVPRETGPIFEVDFWILVFFRKNASEDIKRLRGVKVVQSLMAGVDWILPWLPPEAVLCDGRGIHDVSTSEWVMAAILSCIKRIPRYTLLQQKQEWVGQASVNDNYASEPPPQTGLYRVLGDDLAERTVLIVGYGSIGAAIEARLAPFGINILRVARSARSSPEVSAISELHSLLPKADIVVLIVPLTDETRGLIGSQEIALMKKNALLVNAARGPVVDTDALLAALHADRIQAALDVTDPEPLPPGHPLWSAPNCLITPHVAGSTPGFIFRGFRFAAEQLHRYMAGQALENIVSPLGY